MSVRARLRHNERGLWAPFVWGRCTLLRRTRRLRWALGQGMARLYRSLYAPFDQIAPEESVWRAAPPWTALFRPGPCAAFALLCWNDHVAKGSGWLHPALTGKLSDFAGLAFFPLLLVTCLNVVGFIFCRWLPAVVSLASLQLPQLRVSCIATGIAFSAIQLSPLVAELYRELCVALVPWEDGRVVRVVSDPSDLWALVALGLSYRWGKQAIARVPPGRFRLLRAHLSNASTDALRRARVQRILRDVRACQPVAVAPQMERLMSACAAAGPETEIDACLFELRARLGGAQQTCKPGGGCV